MPTQNNTPSLQHGSVVLGFLLILVVSVSYYLVRDLNRNIRNYKLGVQTTRSLEEARHAVISWAVNHPVNPGTLPYPDRNGDGSYDGDIDCANIANNGNLLGRLPWRGIQATCKDAGDLNGLKINVFDSSGQHLWYAVSGNMLYETPRYPTISPAVLEKTTGWIVVRDRYGEVISDRVAFVIIAPGPALPGQDRSGTAPDPDEFLDSVTIDTVVYDHGDTGSLEFVRYPDSDLTADSGDSFNDRLVYVTVDELMTAVMQRVLNETGKILSGYLESCDTPPCNLKLPWLSPFADPKPVAPVITGTADADSNNTTLVDSAVNFRNAGISEDDLLVNVSDGSIGFIDKVDDVEDDTVLMKGLELGSQNDFDTGEIYFIFPQSANYVTNYISSTATSGSNGLELEDSGKDFENNGIITGDVIRNIDDGGSAGIVVDIDNDVLTVKSLTGGTENDFDNTESYSLYTNMGTHTAVLSVNQLEDDSKDFNLMGVAAGDLVINLTDESIGRITNVGAATLDFDRLYFGGNNSFTTGDAYTIPRFNAVRDTPEGHLSIHDVGEYFASAFDIDWSITVDSGDVVFDSSGFSQAQGGYRDALEDYLEGYATGGGTYSPESADVSNGTCRWMVPDIAECYSWFDDFVNISGSITSGTNTATITDSSATFITDGIKRGDIAMNFDDESFVLSGTTDAGTSGTATAGSNDLTLEDTSNHFINADVSIGEMVCNTTDGSDGVITSVSTNVITVSSLTGGTNNVFTGGDDYVIDEDCDLTEIVSRLYDASADFTSYEPYSYVIQNNTLEAELSETKIQGVISDVIDANTLEVTSYPGEGTEPVHFRENDGYFIYQPDRAVVTDVVSGTVVNTDNYTSGTNPDFDYFFPYGEYYRIMPAASSTGGSVSGSPTCSYGSSCTVTDPAGDFINKGIRTGDVIEVTTTEPRTAFGEINNVTSTSVTAALYGDLSNALSTYTIYYDHVFSRRHEWHTRFRGNQVTGSDANGVRVRDVCMGYDGTDCSTLLATTFSGNGGTPLISVRDYREDGTTEVGRVEFLPTAASTGSLKVSNIEFYLHSVNVDLNDNGDYTDQGDIKPDIPAWFIRNKWYQYIYIAYSDGDIPGAAAACTAAVDCLTLSTGTQSRNDIRALIILTSSEQITQSWTGGTINDYFDSAENTDTDDFFNKRSPRRMTGTTSFGSGGLVLVDSGNDFVSMGITPGYTIRNLTDGSYGKIQTVDSANQITVESLTAGDENDFDQGESYEIYNNDMIRIAYTCPSDSTKLCWSH